MDNNRLELSTKRIESLSDGIFAIAMTILVLNLQLPHESITGSHLNSLLLGQMDKFINYAVSFILLAMLWVRHHQQFHFIKKADPALLWINIFILMFTALIPFSTSLVNSYAADGIDELFFAVNFFFIGFFLWMNWWYATKKCALVDADLGQAHIDAGIRRGAVMPLAAVLAMLMAVIYPPACTVVYLSIPFILLAPWFR